MAELADYTVQFNLNQYGKIDLPEKQLPLFQR